MRVLGFETSEKLEAVYNGVLKNTEKLIDINDLKILGERGSSCFAAAEELTNCFKIYTSLKLSKELIECNLAHELLHVVQYSKKYPYPVAVHSDSVEEKFCVALRSLVLDLSVEDKLKEMEFDSSYFLNKRFESILKKPKNQTGDISGNDYMEKITSINLALVYILSDEIHKSVLINKYKGKLDIVLNMALKISEIINKIGYKTKEQTLICFGEIITLLEVWDKVNLFDGANNTYSKSQYRVWTRKLREELL